MFDRKSLSSSYFIFLPFSLDVRSFYLFSFGVVARAESHVGGREGSGTHRGRDEGSQSSLLHARAAANNANRGVVHSGTLRRSIKFPPHRILRSSVLVFFSFFFFFFLFWFFFLGFFAQLGPKICGVFDGMSVRSEGTALVSL